MPPRLCQRGLISIEGTPMIRTALLAAARARGATAHPGHGMLYGQMVEIARFFGLAIAPGNVPRLFG